LADSNNQVTILPLTVEGVAREIPSNIKLDTRLSTYKKFSFKSVINLLFSKYLYLEILFKPEVLFSFYKFRKTLFYIYAGENIAHKLTEFIKKPKEENILIYCYWANQSAFAAAILKENIPTICAVTRCHGYDLYRERNYGGFAVMEKKFLNSLDGVFPCSRDGADYLAYEYNIIRSKIHMARLGTYEYGCGGGFNNEKTLHIVSCSYAVPVKRLDLVVETLALLKTDREVVWTHIGDGPQLSLLKCMVEERLSAVSVIWKGNITNDDVMLFYKTHKIDCFINVSSSEGIPVSIMEATSFGVPVVALDVGGISEIVNQNNGALLRSDVTAQEIAGAVTNICQRNSDEFRKLVKKQWCDNYSGANNYPEFLSVLGQLVHREGEKKLKL
jgi:colanic acid/amylovoran biosynthesis glycosyltransferase